MVNKKGDYKYGIILSLILGVMVLSLSLYFIFQELWSDDELDWEICRQSIQIRALLPDVEKWGITVDSFKDTYPLKCKTMVVEIEKSDVKNIKNAQKIIAETMARCWALYDKGDSNAFPSKVFKSSVCAPCARIHLTEDAKKYMEDKKMTGINIRESLMNLKMAKEYTYYEYLSNSGKKFSAFNFGNGFAFDLEGREFGIETDTWPWKYSYLTNRLSGGEFMALMASTNVFLPEVFDITKGDLLINYGIVTMGNEGFGDYVPYLFYFQANQRTNPFGEAEKNFIVNLWTIPKDGLGLLYDFITGKGKEAADKYTLGFCEQWEGIPA